MKTRFIETFVNEFNMFAVRSKKESFDEILNEFVCIQRESGESRRVLANGLESYFKMNMIAFNCDHIKESKACILYLISNILFGIINNPYCFYRFSECIQGLSVIRENSKKSYSYNKMKEIVVNQIKREILSKRSLGTCSALYKLYAGDCYGYGAPERDYAGVLLKFNQLAIEAPLNNNFEWYKDLSHGEIEEREPLFNAFLSL